MKNKGFPTWVFLGLLAVVIVAVVVINSKGGLLTGQLQLPKNTYLLCNQIHNWMYRDGNFTSQHDTAVNRTYRSMCQARLGTLWYNSFGYPPRPNYHECSQLQEWMNGGVFTRDHDDSRWVAGFCYDVAHALWNRVPGRPNYTRCDQLKRYLDAGTLTRDHARDIGDADYCQSQNPTLWQQDLTPPTFKRCYDVQTWLLKGTLSSQADRWAVPDAYYCSNQDSDIWNNVPASKRR